jgi:hypothetical protein
MGWQESGKPMLLRLKSVCLRCPAIDKESSYASKKNTQKQVNLKKNISLSDALDAKQPYPWIKNLKKKELHQLLHSCLKGLKEKKKLINLLYITFLSK